MGIRIAAARGARRSAADAQPGRAPGDRAGIQHLGRCRHAARSAGDSFARRVARRTRRAGTGLSRSVVLEMGQAACYELGLLQCQPFKRLEQRYGTHLILSIPYSLKSSFQDPFKARFTTGLFSGLPAVGLKTEGTGIDSRENHPLEATQFPAHWALAPPH